MTTFAISCAGTSTRTSTTRSASSGSSIRRPRTSGHRRALWPLTDDCVYELVGTEHAWHGHEGATRFYTGLLTAFPDIDFQLTDIVIGPQEVCEEADVTGTHEQDWVGYEASGERVEFRVVIFFPGTPSSGFSRGRVHVDLGRE